MADEQNRAVPRSQADSFGWMQDAPGGDLNLDELFPNPEVHTTISRQEPAAVSQTPPAVPQDFIVTQTGTRYRSIEDTVKGIEEKDRIIAELRAAKAAELGHDPLRRTPEAPVKDPRQEVFERLSKAAHAANAQDYIDILQEITRQTMAPYAPMIAEVGREKAIRSVSAETPQIREFVGSADYRAVLERRPRLAQAISAAESDPNLVDQLQEFYSLAYSEAVARRVPEIARAAQTAQPPNPRPTLSSTTPTPGNTPGQPGRINESMLYSREGRKAIMESGRANLMDADWGKNGL